MFANPIPAEHEIPHHEIQRSIDAAVAAAETQGGPSGKDVTPFILGDILARTGGRSIRANRALVLNNAAMGARVAVELARLDHGSASPPRADGGGGGGGGGNDGGGGP